MDWDFAEFTEVYQIETDFAAKVESEFNKMLQKATAGEETDGLEAKPFADSKSFGKNEKMKK